MVSPQKACEMMGICSATLRVYEKKGAIRVCHLPYGDIRVPVSEIDRIQGNGHDEPKIVEKVIPKVVEKPTSKFSIEDHLRYSLDKYDIKDKIEEVAKICRLIKDNTKFTYDEISDVFNKLYGEGVIYNDGGKRASHLTFADKVDDK